MLELVVDLGFRKIEDLAGNITQDIQKNLNESFRRLTALNFLCLIMAFAFIGFLASGFQWILDFNGISVSPIHWMFLSLGLLFTAGLTFYFIDRRVGSFKEEQKKQNEQWVEIGSIALQLAKDYYQNQKLESEVIRLKQELQHHQQNDYRKKYEEKTQSNQFQ